MSVKPFKKGRVIYCMLRVVLRLIVKELFNLPVLGMWPLCIA